MEGSYQSARRRNPLRSWGNLKGVSKGTVEFGDLGRRQGRYEMGELTLEHQSEKIAADCGHARQAVFRPEHDLSCESQDLTINRRTDDSRNILVFSDEGSGHYDVKARLCPTFGDSLARPVDLATPHERACSEISTRACRASRLRCFRNTSLSFASISRRCCRSANSRSAARTRADRLRSRGEVFANSSNSFKVVSSMVTAIVFILDRVSAFLVHFNASDPAEAVKTVFRRFPLVAILPGYEAIAEAFDLTIPPEVLMRADKVIK